MRVRIDRSFVFVVCEKAPRGSQRCDACGRQAVLRGQVGLLHDQHDDENGRGQGYGNVGCEFLHLTGGGTLSLSSSASPSSFTGLGTFTPGIVLIRDISELLLLTGYRTKDARQVSEDGGAGRSSMLSPWNWFECADRKFPVVLGRRDGSLHLGGHSVPPNLRNPRWATRGTALSRNDVSLAPSVKLQVPYHRSPSLTHIRNHGATPSIERLLTISSTAV